MNQADLEKKLSPAKMMIPIVIGLAVVSWLFFREFDPTVFQSIEWGGHTLLGLIGILILVFIRMFGYTLRLRILTDNEMDWRRCFEVIVLWSFASAISPSAVGGTALAIVILTLEGLSVGRSTAVAIATLLLDLIFFVAFSLLVYAVLGADRFFGGNGCGGGLGIQEKFGSFQYFFFLVLGGMVVYLGLIFYATFGNSDALRAILNRVFSLKFLKKFKANAIKTVDDIDTSATVFKSKPPKYFLALLGSTMLTWTARFLLVNPVIASFVPLHFLDHLTLYARNFVLWMVMIVPTTPGASGVSEVALSELICEFLPNPALSPLVILVWRSFDYFLYLILGMIVIPRWIRRVFAQRAKSSPKIKT